MDTGFLLILLLVMATLQVKVMALVQQPIRHDLCDLEACKCSLDGKVNCNCEFTSVNRIEISKDGTNISFPLSVSVIQIENCALVSLGADSLRGLQALQRVEIVNVKSVLIEPHGMAWDEDRSFGTDSRGIVVHIDRSTVQISDYAFRGSINVISFTTVYFSHIKSYAFTNLNNLEKIHLSDCELDNVEIQSFKKISMDKLIIENSKFLSHIPSRTFFEVTCRKELKLFHVYFEHLASLSFMVHVLNTVKIESSYFKLIEGDAFHLKVKGNVFIEDNYFHDMRDGALYGISSQDEYEDSELLFENNTIHLYEDNALKLNATHFRLRVNDVVFNTKCSCSVHSTQYTDKILCEHSNQLVKYNVFLAHQCKVSPSNVLQVYGLVVLITVLLCVALGVYAYKKAYHQYCYRLLNIGTVPKRKLKKPKMMKNGIKPTIVVLPYNNDVYRETEYHVLPEKLVPIQPIENEMFKLHSIQTDM
ncbi:hypothetical protein WDU94_001362 [Cyamophila willieti]